MGYLDIALMVVGDDLEEKEGQNPKDSLVNLSKTNCEISELSEIRGPLNLSGDSNPTAVGVSPINTGGYFKPKPYLDGDGDPVISADCDRRYIWWHPGGMSLIEIIEELKNERPTKQDNGNGIF